MSELGWRTIGRLNEVEEELRAMIEQRTGYVIEFTDRSILARWAEATVDERIEIADMLINQARAAAEEQGL